jgi:hypothetical protein
MTIRASRFDRALTPLHRWVWRDPARRARKLLRFAQTEEGGCRDISRAAELTADPLLRHLFFQHALDERRHGELFRARAAEILGELRDGKHEGWEMNWLAPGERGLDDLRVERERQDSLLAFLHLSEKAAAGRFAVYQQVLGRDPRTRAIFENVMKDEVFHMSYTQRQLSRLSPDRHRLRLWQARIGRVWRAYLRLASAIAGILGSALLLLQYFLLLPPFAWLAKRAAQREPQGWRLKAPPTPLKSQY